MDYPFFVTFLTFLNRYGRVEIPQTPKILMAFHLTQLCPNLFGPFSNKVMNFFQINYRKIQFPKFPNLYRKVKRKKMENFSAALKQNSNEKK
jgi:hypothetical protein